MTINRARSLLITTFAASLFLVGAGGCRKNRERSEVPGSGGSAANQRPVEPGPGSQQMGTQQQDPDLAILTITFIDIDSKLAATCGIPDTKTSFKYDSANPSADAKDRLDQLASCSTTGAAKGKELRIVGRTDQAGSDAYSQQQGKTRAAAVGDYLRTKGVQSQRVDIESKPEEGAPATPSQWPSVRRVTLRVQE